MAVTRTPDFGPEWESTGQWTYDGTTARLYDINGSTTAGAGGMDMTVPLEGLEAIATVETDGDTMTSNLESGGQTWSAVYRRIG